MDKQNSLVLLSSEVMISEESKLHPVFLTVQFLLASNAGNANREGISKAFIDDVVARHEVFECLPMYVDMERLLEGDFEHLTHLFSRETKSFGTVQFGSLTNFYEETDEDGVTSLYAEARFPKRELEACTRLVELYERGMLCVSLEVRYVKEHTFMKDGVMFIDAHEDNALTGMCIVSHPAEIRATALTMVAENSLTITEGEEHEDRGETDLKDKEKMTAEVTEEAQETAVAEETNEAAPEAEAVVVAEDAPAEDEEENESEPEAEADPEDNDPEDRANAEVQDAQAEVLEHSVDTHESVENWGGEPVHVLEVRERVIETLEQAENVIAEKDQKINELETRIAELEQIEKDYNAIIAEREAQALAEKQAKAQAFAEKQGLDVTDVAVAEAISALDYAKIAELTMAQVKGEEPEAKEEPAQMITLASFVELDVGEQNSYGGLLNRRNK